MGNDDMAAMAHIVFAVGALFVVEMARAKLWAYLFPARSEPVRRRREIETPRRVLYGKASVIGNPVLWHRS